jgi:chemotaxis protein methyltransferase CheR
MVVAAPVFAILNTLVEERTGIHYQEDDAPLLFDKVMTRAREVGFESALDYYYFLQYDDPERREFDALIDALVVPETFFFRELDALRCVVSEFVAPRVARGERPRVWCAACATGEEPFTLAMLLAKEGLLDAVDLLASDVSHRNLARAREGRFGGRALRQVPDPELVARFLQVVDGVVRVQPEIARAVDFRRVNLIDPDSVRALGRFDVVICRNVLIYFRDETIARVVGELCHAMRPDGALVVGVSESLVRFGPRLVCEERRGTFVYRKARP